ncbi:MAG: PqqD family peptide modification chaperone [Pseudomonadota bacterium]
MPDQPVGERYILNQSEFASERFDDEVIVLNTANGTYYALTGSAPQIWAPLIQGTAVSAVAAHVAEAAGVDVARVSGELSAFVAALEAENILLAADSAAKQSEALDLAAGADYQGFVWDKHADLDELLVLDPIHEVDPQKGWPHGG